MINKTTFRIKQELQQILNMIVNLNVKVKYSGMKSK